MARCKEKIREKVGWYKHYRNEEKMKWKDYMN